MTFCEILKDGKTEKGRRIIAEKRVDKYSSVEKFSVSVSVDGIALVTIPTARTTWKKRFSEAQKQY